MSSLISDWLNLVIRWAHVITAIAWIGASFYFNWLLNRLRQSDEGDELVTGQLWAIHAGGFFKVQKRRIPPGRLPEPLHWFKWEAYWTWITGFALLVLIYYLNARAYLIDIRVADISPALAVSAGIGTLVIGWLTYHLLWQLDLFRNHRRPGAIISFALLVVTAWALTQIFSGRGAYIHTGALLGTLMVGNVFAVIMPAQRQLVAATQAGTAQDESLAANAELRSLHNNYMTLPVVLVMISMHYPRTYGHDYAWAVLAVLFLAGVLVRHYFNVRQRPGNWRAAWMPGLAAIMIAALAVATAPSPPAAAAGEVTFAEVRGIIDTHCVDCHSANPARAEFGAAIKGVMFDTPQQIRDAAPRILAQAVDSRAMPLGNQSGMTEKERALLGRWIREGAGIP